MVTGDFQAPKDFSLSKEEFGRLRSAMASSFKAMKNRRKERVDAVKELVGFHYGANGSDDKVPVNLLYQFKSIVSRSLAARKPKVKVRAKQMRLRPTGKSIELATDLLLDEIGFAETLSKVIDDALFSIGIVKIALNQSGSVEIGGVSHDVGQAYVDVVDLDDFVFDTNARRWEQVAFIGNRERVPLDDVKNCGLYENVELLKPSNPNDSTEFKGEKTSEVGTGSKKEPDDFLDYVDLWHVWLPRTNRVLTFPVDQENIVLRDVEWTGPESGMYKILGFGDVPGNLLPLSPISMLIDLHLLVNEIFRKLGRQAQRQKSVGVVPPDAVQDGEKTIRANDGDVVVTENANAVKEFDYGGINQSNFAFFIQGKDLFSWLGGNLDSLGGLGPMADTLGQDQMMVQNASKQITEMQDRVYNFVSDIVEQLAWYVWTDPLREFRLKKTMPGSTVAVETVFTPESREGSYMDFHFSIVPYSMQEQTPAIKIANMDKVLTTFIPLMPVFQSQGKTLNTDALTAFYAENASMPEINEIFMSAEPIPIAPQGGEGDGVMKPPVSTHNYVRSNRPGATRVGKDQALISTLMGGNVQPKEQAGMMRSVG